MKKILTYSILTLAIFGLCGVAVVNAQNDSNGFNSTIIQKLVDRFNLNANEVEEVFGEFREENHQIMKNRFENRTGLMDTLTEDQKTALAEKKQEMRENLENCSDLTNEERQTIRQEHREEFKAWAEENGIEIDGMSSRGMFKSAPHEHRAMKAMLDVTEN